MKLYLPKGYLYSKCNYRLLKRIERRRKMVREKHLLSSNCRLQDRQNFWKTTFPSRKQQLFSTWIWKYLKTNVHNRLIEYILSLSPHPSSLLRPHPCAMRMFFTGEVNVIDDLGLYAFSYYLTRFSAKTSFTYKFAVWESIHALGAISGAHTLILP